MYNEEKYKLVDEIETAVNALQRKFAKLRRSVNECIADLEAESAVEDFLQNGPGGIDPE